MKRKFKEYFSNPVPFYTGCGTAWVIDFDYNKAAAAALITDACGKWTREQVFNAMREDSVSFGFWASPDGETENCWHYPGQGKAQKRVWVFERSEID